MSTLELFQEDHETLKARVTAAEKLSIVNHRKFVNI